MKPTISNQDFIIFGEDFGRHPHSLEHLLRPLFSQNRFLWVETIGLRSPKFSLYDLKRALGKVRGWLAPKSPQQVARNIPQNVFIISPLMIPFNQFKAIRAFNTWSVNRAVKSALHQHQFKKIITVASVPNACDYVGNFGEILRVYFCVDDFTIWPGLDYNLVNKMEKQLLSKADLVFATSDALKQSRSNGQSETILLTHGVDFSHFDIGLKNINNSSVKLCYFGLFDERSDQNIIATIAENLSDCEVHIIGNKVCSAEKLQGLSNIFFHGAINYDKLPDAIRDMDIFILPYVQNKLANNINPLKLKEYLSTGRPVIATPLPEIMKLKEHLYLAENGTEFVNQIRLLVAGKSSRDSHATLEFLKSSETWNAKAKLFSEKLQSELK